MLLILMLEIRIETRLFTDLRVEFINSIREHGPTRPPRRRPPVVPGKPLPASGFVPSRALVGALIAREVVSMLIALAVLLALVPPGLANDREVRVAIGPSDTISVVVDGTHGRPVVVIPGVLGGAYSFRHVTDSLAAKGHVVYTVGVFEVQKTTTEKTDFSLDTQAKRVGAVLDSLELRDAILITHSLGGSVGYRLALQRPDLVSGIVAVEAGPSETAATPSMNKAVKLSTLIRLLGARRLIEKNVRDGLRKGAYDQEWINETLIDEYVDNMASDFGRTVKAMRAMLASKEPAPLAPQLRNIQVPVRLLTSGKVDADGTIPPDQVETLRSIPDFEVQLVERTGPWIQEERADAVVAAVLAVSR